MAKRQPKKSATSDKARLELRFDQDVYDGIKDIADRTGISVNQLMQGLARWAINWAHVGEPVWEDEGRGIDTIEQPGCVWFGQDYEAFEGPAMAPHPVMACALDFTERRVVRDDFERPSK